MAGNIKPYCRNLIRQSFNYQFVLLPLETVFLGPGIARWLRVLPDLAEGLYLFPRAHAKGLTTTCNLSFRSSGALFWTPWALTNACMCSCTYVYTPTHLLHAWRAEVLHSRLKSPMVFYSRSWHTVTRLLLLILVLIWAPGAQGPVICQEGGSTQSSI